ncbi:MAG: hypothetical protein QNK04_13350 [Myxococcota bacterium]|nr:hypothetical protein [Myxococcota bacterium]
MITTSELASATLLLNFASTLYMMGLVWFVQIVHYPLFAHVGSRSFPGYERAHVARTSPVVGPPMLVEAATTALLLLVRPAGVPLVAPWVGAGLLAVIWLSTILLQVPGHRRLGDGFDGGAHRRLVVSNWIRTTAWTARGSLGLWMVFQHLLAVRA